jgi:hypothetical protein
MPIMNVAEYARHRGCTASAVRQALKKGQIPAEPNGSVDSVRADAAWAANIRPRKGGGRLELTLAQKQAALDAERGVPGDPSAEPPPTATGELTAQRTRGEKLRADREELTLQRLRGEVVHRGSAVALATAFGQAWRQMIEGWVTLVAPDLAGDLEVDPRKVELALERHVRKLLEDLAAVRFNLDPEV